MKKRAPFAWREVKRGDIPECAGVYAVYMENRVVYIGSTLNLRRRAGMYLRLCREMPSYDHGPSPAEVLDLSLTRRVKVKPARQVGEWLMREYRLIHRLQPKGNSIGVQTARFKKAAAC